MYKNLYYVFCGLLVLGLYFWTLISSVFSDNKSSNILRENLSGYWVLVSHNPYAKTAFIGADGSVISFSKYFISTKTNFLPKQYSLRYISYEMDGKTFKDQAVIILSKGDKYNDWMRDGYAVTKISADSLKLVPTYMIQGSLNPKEYTFKRVRKE